MPTVKRTTRKSPGTNRWYSTAAFAFLLAVQSTNSFPLLSTSRIQRFQQLHTLVNPELEHEINRGLDRARTVLEKSKAKLIAKEQQQKVEKEDELPFFATGQRSVSRDGVIKFVDERTGLRVADGERMAAISEHEDWEMRSISQVFESEIEDAYTLANRQLGQRDVAASIWNLRQSLHNDDYRRIFDTKNRFIGEDI